MADTNKNYCKIKESTINKVHRFQDDTSKKFKSKTQLIYYGGADGYYIQYPAKNTQLERGLCNCSKYDPRFRYMIFQIT